MNIIGIVIILFGILLGIYVGGYLLLFDGIVEIVDQIAVYPDVDSVTMAINIIKILFGTTVGLVIFYVFLIIGIAV